MHTLLEYKVTKSYPNRGFFYIKEGEKVVFSSYFHKSVTFTSPFLQ